MYLLSTIPSMYLILLTVESNILQYPFVFTATLRPNILSRVVEDEDEEIGGDNLTLDESLSLLREWLSGEFQDSERL